MKQADRFLLASASPRRAELLSRLGVPFDIAPVEIAEDLRGGGPEVVARRLARMKAEAARLRDPDPLIVAADTIVWHNGRPLGKPADPAEARSMLRALRGETHEVVTAVAVMPRRSRGALARHPLTHVRLRDLTDGEIEASIARGDPFDKAGAYAIQDELLDPVASYDGCYCNVVGLPLWPTIELLRRAGLRVSVQTADLLPQCAGCRLAPARSG